MIVQYWKQFFQGWEIEIETPTLETDLSRLEHKIEVQYRKKRIYKIGQSVI